MAGETVALAVNGANENAGAASAAASIAGVAEAVRAVSGCRRSCCNWSLYVGLVSSANKLRVRENWVASADAVYAGSTEPDASVSGSIAALPELDSEPDDEMTL